MAKAFIALTITAGKEEVVLGYLKRQPGVNASLTYGVYDAMVEIDRNSRDKLKKDIDKIRKGIKEYDVFCTTLTMQVVK